MLWPHFIVRIKRTRNHQNVKHHEKLMERCFLTELRPLNASAQTLLLNTLLHVINIKEVSVEDLGLTTGSHDTKNCFLVSRREDQLQNQTVTMKLKSLITEPNLHQNRRYTAYRLGRILAKNV